EVELQGAALPVAAERVAQVELELRPVERALAGGERIPQPGGFAGVAQARLGMFPDRVAADAQLRPRGEFYADILETEILVDREQQLAERDRLVLDLLFGAEDMRVVLGKGAHPHDAMQRAR